MPTLQLNVTDEDRVFFSVLRRHILNKKRVKNMTCKLCKVGNLVAFLALVLTFLTLTVEHAVAGEEGGENEALVGGRPHSEVMSKRLHPMVVITRRDIELSGIVKLSDLLSQKSNFNDFGSHRPFILGPGRYTVIVNGKHATSFDIDLDLIPVSAIERIEIFKDSASAPYIGKATSALVNIVFRDDYEGLEVRSGIGRPRAEGGDSEYLGAIWGRSLGEGHITLGAEIFRRNEVRDADRDYSRAIYTPGGPLADAQGVSIGGNTLFLTTADGKEIRAPLGDCDESAYTGILTTSSEDNMPGSVCGFSHADISWHLRRRENDNAFMDFQYPVGDATVIHVKARAARSRTKLLQAPESVGFSFTPTEMLKQNMINNIEGLDERNFPREISVEHSFLGHGNLKWNTDVRDYDISVGVEGEIKGDIDYHADIHYNRYEYMDTGGTYVHIPTIKAAIENGNYDIQDPLSEAAKHKTAIVESSLQRYVEKQFHHIESIVILDGPLFEILGNKLSWLAGYQLSYNKQSNTYEYFDRLDHLVDPGDALGEVPNSVTVGRRVLALFGDIWVPLGNALDLSLSGRYENLEDLPAIFLHRIASLYRITPNLALRASWSRGSRFPGLFELYEKRSVTYPFVCDADTVTADCPAERVEFSQNANQNLEPDRTESFAAGVSAGRGPFYASVDWFRLRTSDIPSMLDPQFIVTLERRGRLSNYPEVKVIRNDGRLSGIENPFTNSGESDIDGVDIGIKTDWEIGWANFMLNANWLRITNYERRIAGQVQPEDIPRNRLHLLLSASRADMTVRWNLHAVSGYWNDDRSKRYRRWVGHDVVFNWENAFGFKWLELTGGMLNIGNEGQSRPGQDEDQVLYLDSILGRTLFLTTKFEL